MHPRHTSDADAIEPQKPKTSDAVLEIGAPAHVPDGISTIARMR